MLSKMILPKIYRLKFAVAIWLGIFLLVTIACVPLQRMSLNTATAIPSSVNTATIQCEQTLEPPQIIDIRPAPATPGSEITVIGSGGYIQDTCGGYFEGSKLFKLYLDNEPIGDLSCYVNHCEGKIIVPSTLSTGAHCLSVERDQCQFEFQIVLQ